MDIPQVFAILVADKMSLNKIVATKKFDAIYLGNRGCNYISSIKDAISDDWKIVD
jgi:hypothetical protein